MRLEPNAVLQALYESVGIKTIVLDPENGAKTRERKTALLDDFMLELALRVSSDALIPGINHPMYLSKRPLELINLEIKEREEMFGFIGRGAMLLDHVAKRAIPAVRKEEVRDLLRLLSVSAHHRATPLGAGRLALSYALQFGPCTEVTLAVALALTHKTGRPLLDAPDDLWSIVLSPTLGPPEATLLIKRLKAETDYQERERGIDDDIAYSADFVARIAQGELLASRNEVVEKEATEALREASAVYASIAGHRPARGTKPEVSTILAEIARRRAERAEGQELVGEDGDDIPF